MMELKEKTVLLVDGYSLIFRGFHALPILSTGDGVYTNAVHGFFNMLIKALDTYRPQALCVMMDMHAPTFRHTLYEAYKGTRKPMPEELRPQPDIVRELLHAMNIRVCEMEGYEADDLLGTASRIADKQGWKAYILTGDRDSLQLVGGNTQVILTRKGITDTLLLDAEGVKNEFGYTPEQVPDMKGLMGDSSDNIPGIAGVGEKTALKLIAQYGTLDEVLSHAGEIKGKLGEKIQNGKDVALLSRNLGTIRCTAPLELDLSECTWQGMNCADALLERYELKALIRSIHSLLGTSTEKTETAVRSTGASKRAQGKSSVLSAAPSLQNEEDELPEELPVRTSETLSSLEAVRKAAQKLAAETETPIALHMTDSEITLFDENGCLWHIPLLMDMLTPGLDLYDALQALLPVLSTRVFLLHDAKAWAHRMHKLSLPLPKTHTDTMIAAYLLHTAQENYRLSTCLKQEYAEPMSEDAHAVASLAYRQRARLQRRGMTALLDEMEQPLTRVLFDMEKEGFWVDGQTLTELGQWFTSEIEEAKQAVYRLTGEDGFNLNSPVQLSEVLFEKLKLPAPAKKTSRGYSTSAEVLEELADLHPAIGHLLRFRKMSKLQSTYIEGLSRLRGADGRVHSTFDQTATVTGRISSMEPNLQNIPIRTEEGREIRRAFVAKDGCVLVDADYSQIELRVLAHLSGDEAMCDAFIRAQDIHTRTAAEIHGVSMDQVTPEMRRAAKATNFGIVYGISAFGLAKNARIGRRDAQLFIKRYFERYPLVRQFMDDCVENGKRTGYAETMFHRRRELFELRSSNRNVRSFGERAAMNTPVQGTAADLIKLAMVKVASRLEKEGYRAKLILQVHDELVVECPVEEQEAVCALLKETMESVAKLRVPLVAELAVGKNWDEAH